jgi:hypothetical protein
MLVTLIEDAAASPIPQLSKALPVDTHKPLFLMSHRLQQPNIRFRQQHFSFFAAKPAV